MQKYKYVAININKKKFTGTFLAESEENLREQLASQNLFLVEAKLIGDKTPNVFFSTSSNVKISEITNFCRQFSILSNAGISIVDSIGILKTQSYSALFKQVLEMVHDDVKAGLLLSEAFEKHEKVFPEFFRSMTYVGEMSGSLDAVLNDLANYYESDDKMRRKAKSAMVYPIVLLCMLVGIVGLMLLFVVPTFRGALDSLNVEMPALTMAIFNMSEFFLNSWMYIVGGLVVIILGIKIYAGTVSGRYTFDAMKLKVPLLSNITINTVASRFAHGFALLLSSGMDLIDAMDVMVNVFGNKCVEKKFADATEDVRKGTSLTRAVDEYQLFPQILTQMISVGERTGALDEVLVRAAPFYDEQVEIALNSLTTVLQPVILCILGVAVAVMFIAVYSPMLSIMQTLG